MLQNKLSFVFFLAAAAIAHVAALPAPPQAHVNSVPNTQGAAHSQVQKKPILPPLYSRHEPGYKPPPKGGKFRELVTRLIPQNGPIKTNHQTHTYQGHPIVQEPHKFFEYPLGHSRELYHKATEELLVHHGGAIKSQHPDEYDHEKMNKERNAAESILKHWKNVADSNRHLSVPHTGDPHPPEVRIPHRPTLPDNVGIPNAKTYLMKHQRYPGLPEV